MATQETATTPSPRRGMYSGSRARQGVDQGRVCRGWVCGVEGGAEQGKGVEGGRAAPRACREWVLGADSGAT